MAGRDQVVIDDVQLPEFVAWSDVAFHAGGSSLVQALFGVHKASDVSTKSSPVVRMQPLAPWTVTRFTRNAERVFVGRSCGTVRTWRGMAADAASPKR